MPCPVQAQHLANASDQYGREGVPDNGDRKQRAFEAAVMKCSSRKADSSLDKGEELPSAIIDTFLVLGYETC